MSHVHTCKSCAQTYTHTHAHTTPDHKQADYQCPYEECPMYVDRGVSGYPDRKPRKSDVPPLDDAETPPNQPNQPGGSPSGNPTPPKKPETKLEKDVRIAYRDGRFTCDNTAHYKSVKDPANPRFTKAAPLSSIQIIDKMVPMKAAKCDCERKACRDAWTWDSPGTFNNNWVSPGAFFKGIGVPGQKFDEYAVPLRVMPVRYRLSPEAVKVLHSRFPGWIFTSIGSGDHDHPIAHTTNLVNSFEMTSQFRRNKRYLDLHGSPNVNERLVSEGNLSIDTLVSLESAKDYVRQKLKWGEEVVNNRRRYYNCALRDVVRDHSDMVEAVDEVVSFHTLYYYERREIAALLAATKGNTMTALVHRFKGEEGSLNGNEQLWRKERVGNRARVIQTNALTGEQYSHGDMEQWFDGTGFWSPFGQDVITMSDATKDALGSLSWTVNKASDDVFRITITAVPNKVAALVVVGDETALTELQATNVVKVVVGETTTDYSIRPELQPIFEEMRGRILVQARTTDKLSAHAQMTHIKCKQYKDKNPGAIVHASEELDIALSSFWVDFEDVAAKTPQLLSKSSLMVAAHAKLMSGKGMASVTGGPKKMLNMMADALGSKSTKDTFAKVFRSLADEL